jgi:hypothetical protein
VPKLLFKSGLKRRGNWAERFLSRKADWFLLEMNLAEGKPHATNLLEGKVISSVKRLQEKKL